MTFDRSPLKRLAVINERELPEDTDPDHELRYVDISSVGHGDLISEPLTMRFEAAPSRARRRVRAGDTIVSTVRTYLRAVWQVPSELEDVVVSTGFAVLSPRGIDPHFFAWSVQSSDFIEQVVARSTGVSFPAINPGDLGRIGLPVPGIPLQRAIANFLGAETTRIDALIAKKRRTIELVHERARTALMELISDFWQPGPRIPLRRIVDRRQALPGIDDEMLTAYRDGAVTARSLRRAEGYTMADGDGTFQHVDRGDLVFHGLDGFAGAVGIASMPGKCSAANHVCKVRAPHSADFIALQLRALALCGYVELQASSVRQRAVDLRNWERFGALPIAVPTSDEQRAAADRVQRARHQADRLALPTARQIELLREHRQALITAAVTGQLDIPGAA